MLFSRWIIEAKSDRRTYAVEAEDATAAVDVFSYENEGFHGVVYVYEPHKVADANMFELEGGAFRSLCHLCCERFTSNIGEWCEDCSDAEARAEQQHRDAHMPGKF